MYSKEEASRMRQAFWTAFGQYMAPVPNADGEKIAWINYKTGIKHLHFKMNAEGDRAEAALEMSHPDAAVQELFFEQFKQVKRGWEEALGTDWTWRMHEVTDDGRTVSRIVTELTGPRIFNKGDWPQLISFFKEKIVAFDAFWNLYQYAFDALK